MAYLGLVPSERSTGDSVRRGGITKTGNARVRRVLAESAWSYRHPAGVGKQTEDLVDDVDIVDGASRACTQATPRPGTRRARERSDKRQ